MKSMAVREYRPCVGKIGVTVFGLYQFEKIPEHKKLRSCNCYNICRFCPDMPAGKGQKINKTK